MLNKRKNHMRNGLTRFVKQTYNEDDNDDERTRPAINDSRSNNNKNNNYRYCCNVSRQLILFIVISGIVLSTFQTTTFIQCAKLEKNMLTVIPSQSSISTSPSTSQAPASNTTLSLITMENSKIMSNHNNRENKELFDETNTIIINNNNNNYNRQHEALTNNDNNYNTEDDNDHVVDDDDDDMISPLHYHDVNYNHNYNHNLNLNLKHVTFENIYHILRDENEPLQYWRDATLQKYPHKRSTSIALQMTTLILKQHNLTEFLWQNYVQQQDLNAILHIDLSENHLRQVDVHEFHQIRYLSLSYNNLTSIPLMENSSVILLNMNYNRIQTSTIKFNLQLRELYLKGNQIQRLASLNLSALPNLEILDLSENLLESFDGTTFFPQMMHQLKMLNLANNHLISIYREAFYNLLNLNTLILSWNNIQNIDYETFLSLPNLQYLDLSSNQLKGIAIRALQGIMGLEVLSIAYNNELGPNMQEFVASWSLKELDASGTGLCQIPAALAQSVRSLKLTNNWLKVINCGDLDSYPLLQFLDLSYSHIEMIEDDALGRLEILQILMLDHNDLDKVPLSLPTSLEHLFLQHNQIMDLTIQTFQNLNQLKTLDLSHNKLLYLPALPLTHLQTLNLQNGEIKGISQTIVYTMPHLNDLMLEGNPIKCNDLMGIAEWASICRLPPIMAVPNNNHNNNSSTSTSTSNSSTNNNIKIDEMKNARNKYNNNDDDNDHNNDDYNSNDDKDDDNLKEIFNKMHNFYKQFEENEALAKMKMKNRQQQLQQQQHFDKNIFKPSCVHQLDLAIIPSLNNKVFKVQDKQQQQQQQVNITTNDLYGKENTAASRNFLEKFYRSHASNVTTRSANEITVPATMPIPIITTTAATMISTITKISLKEKIPSLIGMKSFPKQINQTIADKNGVAQTKTKATTTTESTIKPAPLSEYKISNSWKQKQQPTESKIIVANNIKNNSNNLYTQIKYTTKTLKNATDETKKMTETATVTTATVTTATVVVATSTIITTNKLQHEKPHEKFLNISNLLEDTKAKDPINRNIIKKLSYNISKTISTESATTTASAIAARRAISTEAITLDNNLEKNYKLDTRAEKENQLNKNNYNSNNNSNSDSSSSNNSNNNFQNWSNETAFEGRILKVPTTKSSITARYVSGIPVDIAQSKKQQYKSDTTTTTSTARTATTATVAAIVTGNLVNAKNATKILTEIFANLKIPATFKTMPAKNNLHGNISRNYLTSSNINNNNNITMSTMIHESANNNVTAIAANKIIQNNDNNQLLTKSLLTNVKVIGLQQQQQYTKENVKDKVEDKKSNGKVLTTTIKSCRIMRNGNDKMILSMYPIELKKSCHNNNNNNNNTNNITHNNDHDDNSNNYNVSTIRNNYHEYEETNNNKNHIITPSTSSSSSTTLLISSSGAAAATAAATPTAAASALHNNDINNHTKNDNNHNENLYGRPEEVAMENVKVNEKNITNLELIKPSQEIPAINVKEYTTIKDATTMKTNTNFKGEKVDERNEGNALNENIVKGKLKHKFKYKYEPVLLDVKNRHFMGTPLLIHNGANFMITTDKLILLNNKNINNTSINTKNNSNNTSSYNMNTNRYKLIEVKMESENVSRMATSSLTLTPTPTPIIIVVPKHHHQLNGMRILDHSQITKPTLITFNNNKSSNSINILTNNITRPAIPTLSNKVNLNNTHTNDKFNIIYNDYAAATTTSTVTATAIAFVEAITKKLSNSMADPTKYTAMPTMATNEALPQAHVVERDERSKSKAEPQQYKEIFKPSLIMKQMTVITKQQQNYHQQQHQTLSPLKSILRQQTGQQKSYNDVKQLVDVNNSDVLLTNFHELKPIVNNTYHKYYYNEKDIRINHNYNDDNNNKYLSTIPHAITKDNEDKIIMDDIGREILLPTNRTFQQIEQPLHMTYEQQMLQHKEQQKLQQERQPQSLKDDINSPKLKHWLDNHKESNGKRQQQYQQHQQQQQRQHKRQQSIIVLLTSLILFVMLLLGLMHAYRCAMPWRQCGMININNNNNNHNSNNRQQQQQRNHRQNYHHELLRPWLHQNGPRLYAMEQDEENFDIHHNRGDIHKRWHHSTRQQPPYHSPIHNLNGRQQLQNETTAAIALSDHDAWQRQLPKQQDDEREQQNKQQQKQQESVNEEICNLSSTDTRDSNSINVIGYTTTTMTNMSLPLPNGHGHGNSNSTTTIPSEISMNHVASHLQPSLFASLSSSIVTRSSSPSSSSPLPLSSSSSSSSSLRAVILDDNSFSIEMTPSNGQLLSTCTRKFREEELLLPMELLNMTTASKQQRQPNRVTIENCQQHDNFKMHGIIKQTTTTTTLDDSDANAKEQEQQKFMVKPCVISRPIYNATSVSTSASTSNTKQLTPQKKSRKFLFW